jgi:hypothetical protein
MTGLAHVAEPTNDHNVYVLGAGFSADAGLPVVRNFMTAMRDALPVLRAAGRDEEADAIRHAFEFQLRASAAAYRTQVDVENIEELFCLASAAGDDRLADRFKLAIAATLDVAELRGVQGSVQGYFWSDDARKLLGSIPAWADGFNPGGQGITGDIMVPRYDYYVAAMLGFLASGAAAGRNTFVTFNYDLLIERSLDRLQVPHGFGDLVRASSDDRTERPHVDVLHLHGAMNWQAAGPSSHEKLKIHRNYADLRAHPHPVSPPSSRPREFPESSSAPPGRP